MGGAVGERCSTGRWIPNAKQGTETLARQVDTAGVLAEKLVSQLCNAQASRARAENGQLDAATTPAPPPYKRPRPSPSKALVERQSNEDIDIISVTSSQ